MSCFLQDYYPIALVAALYHARDVLLYGLLFGILQTNNIIIAYVFGFLAGMANSFLDAGTYPSLMEAFPRSPDSQYFN